MVSTVTSEDLFHLFSRIATRDAAGQRAKYKPSVASEVCPPDMSSSVVQASHGRFGSPVRSLWLSNPPPVKFRWLLLDSGLVSVCL